MYVEKLTIKNFRCFEETEAEFNYPGRPATKARPAPKNYDNVNLLLGNNGTGKTSTLMAIGLSIIEPVIQLSGFKGEFLVRRIENEKNRSEIKIRLRLDDKDAELGSEDYKTVTGQLIIQRTKDVETILSRAKTNPPLWEQIYLNDSPAFFIVGYGANRRTERPEGYSEQNRSPRYQRIASLFEDYAGLVPFTWGHLQIDRLGFLTEARNILNGLLGEGVTLTERLDNQGRPLFNRWGALLPFDALSDGFRSFVGWVWDMLFQFARVQSSPDGQFSEQNSMGSAGIKVYKNPENKKLKDVSGVAIVDEIDLFLHPEWQRLVVGQVAKAFPKLQFLFSTHSPLVAGTLEPENIFVMEQEPDGTSLIQQYRESIYGLTANQVLTSSYFGLDSTRAPNTGTLSDLAEKSIAFKNGGEDTLTETAAPLADAQKEMLTHLMEQSKQYEAVLQPVKKSRKGSGGTAENK